MANTIDTALAVKQLVQQSIGIQSPALVPVSKYCTLVPLGELVGRTATVANVTTIQAVIESPSFFENAGDVVGVAQLPAVHLSGQFGIQNSDRQNGLDHSLLISSHLVALQQAIQAKINAVITTANFGAAVATVSSASFAVANLETLMAAVPGRTAVCLHPDYFVKVKPTWMTPGTEGTLQELSDFTSIGTNVVGFSARPMAIVLGFGHPSAGAREVTTSTIETPLGVPVQLSVWAARSSRSWRCSLDVSIAVAVGKAAALRLLKSA